MRKIQRGRIQAAVFFLGAALAGAAPHLEVTPGSVDFGICGHRERITEKVTLRNTGTETLRVVRIHRSCDCTSLTFKGKKVPRNGSVNAEIPPQGQATLQITVSTGRIMGILQKYVELTTTDPTKPKVKIPITARIHHTVRAFPWTLPSFTAVCRGEPVKQHFLLIFLAEPTTDPPLKELKGTERHLSVTARRLTKEELSSEHAKLRGKNTYLRTRRFHAGYRVEVTVRPPEKEGFYTALVTAQVNGKHWEFPVHGYVFDGIVVEPRYFQFGGIEDPTLLQREVTLRSADNTPFDVIGIECVPEILTFEVEASADRRTYRIYARISTEDRSRRFYAKVYVHTSHPKKPTCVISCLGFWKRKAR